MKGRIRYNFAREDRWAMIKRKVRVIIWVMEKIRDEHCRFSKGMDVRIGQSVTPWNLAALEQWSWSGGRMGDNELREGKSLLTLVLFLLWKDTVTRSPARLVKRSKDLFRAEREALELWHVWQEGDQEQNRFLIQACYKREPLPTPHKTHSSIWQNHGTPEW